MLNRVLDTVPSSVVYDFLDTRAGKFLYGVGYSRTRSRLIECEEVSFRMQTPSAELFLWEDYLEEGCHEPMTTQAFVEFLSGSKDSVVWDVGSKCGYFMMVATQFVSPDRVHVFEPESPHVGVIEENNRQWLNGGANVNAVFVGDTSSEGWITGDEYARQHGRPDLVKIDVDGPEVDVLRGMERVITESSPRLLVELHVNEGWESKVKALGEVLFGGDYEYAVVMDHRDAHQQWESVAELSELSRRRSSGQDLLLRCAPDDTGAGDDE